MSMAEKLANRTSRSDKTSWNRKMNNLVTLIAKIRPIEDRIIELQAQKLPIMDEIAALRKEMVDTCIHPIEQLIEKDDYVECKFCGRKVRLNDIGNVHDA